METPMWAVPLSMAFRSAWQPMLMPLVRLCPPPSMLRMSDTWWMARHWMVRATMPCTEAVNTTCRARISVALHAFQVPGIPSVAASGSSQLDPIRFNSLVTDAMSEATGKPSQDDFASCYAHSALRH